MRYEHVIEQQQISSFPRESNRLPTVSLAQFFDNKRVDRSSASVVGVVRKALLLEDRQHRISHPFFQTGDMPEGNVIEPERFTGARMFHYGGTNLPCPQVLLI